MKASWYAEALHRALKNKNKREYGDIIARFYVSVRSRGHAGLLKQVPAELEKIAERDRDRDEVSLVTANASSLAKWSHAYDHYEKEGMLSAGAVRRDIVDGTIIGGFQIRGKNIFIDGSYKRSLVELYKNIINKN